MNSLANLAVTDSLPLTGRSAVRVDSDLVRCPSGQGLPGSAEARAAYWYAAYTNSRHEKFVARQLQDRGIAHCLPSYQSVRRWKDRRKLVELPLFPGYIFVQLDMREKLRVLEVAGVVRFVSFNGKPARLEASEIESIRTAIAGGVHAEPHPYLKVGRRVRIKHGPLSGIEGLLVRKKDKFRVVISIDLIMRSIATEIQVADIEPV